MLSRAAEPNMPPTWRSRPFPEGSSAPFAARVGQLTNGADHRTVNGTADHASGPEQPDGPLEVVRRFEPRHGRTPGLQRQGRGVLHGPPQRGPWLAAARDCPPEVQRVFAALDQGGGHAHIRHEGWVTEEMNERRVAYLEDPAQLDPAKRAAGIDGLRPGDQPHRCRQAASRIIDPDAFAVAFVQGIEHPKVRGALEAPFDPDRSPVRSSCRSGICLARPVIGTARAGSLCRWTAI